MDESQPVTFDESRFNTVFGCVVQRRRLACSATTQQIAARCNLTAAEVDHIEKGDRAVSVQEFLKISQALGTSPDDLYRETRGLLCIAVMPLGVAQH